MKGFLPFYGKLLSPRYLLIPIFLLLISIATVQAKTIVIGAGFGFISVPNMNGLNPGDVLAVSPGTYSGGSFSNLKGITITNNGGTVIFTDKVTLVSLVECTFSNFQFRNVPDIAIRWDGNFRRCIEKNITFFNVGGNANDAQDHNMYTGDTSSLKFYLCSFDSLTLYRTGMVLQGSWGDALAGFCYMDSVVLSRIKVDSTLTNGTEVRGVFFRIDAHDWKVTYKGINTGHNDIGIFYISGNGYFHDIYRFGGRGYILRIWCVGLGSVSNSYIYNNIDLNSTIYGTVDTRIDATQFTKYTTGGNCFIFNNTSGNKDDNNNYWASIAVVNVFPLPYICQTRNNLGFNLTTRGKPPITMNQSLGTWVSDSSNNLYFDKPDGVVDPITCVPVANSPVLGKGITISFIKDDIYHNPRQGAFDIGAVQHGGAIIPPVNQPPVAVVGNAQTITLPVNSATLDGTNSYDGDGNITKYAWTQVSGSGGTITTPATPSTTVTGLSQGTYIFKLSVTDNSNATASALDTIIVKAAANLPPIANAGADQIITLPNNAVNLDGSASRDQDNGGLIAAYLWIQSSGPSAATIGTPAKVSTTISGLIKGIYVFRLIVTDASGASSSDSLIITVNIAANIPPVANAGNSKSIILPVNTSNLDGSLSTDADGNIVSFNWTQISGPAASFITNPVVAITSVNNLVAGQYIFELTVTDDGGAVSKAQVKITVIASGVQPPSANAGANQTITLPVNQVSMDGSVSVAPSGSIVSYNWTQMSGPSVALLTTPGSVQTNANNLVAGNYVFLLTVKDNNNAVGTDSILITVNPLANIPPVANAGSSLTISLPANMATLDGSKSSDADGTIVTFSWTKVSGPNTPGEAGVNTSVVSLSGLIAGQYTYQLQVTDNSGASATALVKVTVVAAPNVLPIANAGPDQSITAPSSSVNLNGTASNDPDGTIVSYSWTMISGQGSVTINNGNTANPSAVGLLPGIYVFQLTVTDNNGASARDQVTITVNPKAIQPNQLPIANAGTNLTLTAPASSTNLNGSSSFDPDGMIVSYSWGQVAGPSTVIISNNGTPTPTVSGLIVGTYLFQITVTDNSGGINTDQVTVTVNPEINKINQMPVAFAGVDTTLYLPASSYMLNANGSFDPDGNIISYQWQQITGPNTALPSDANNPRVVISNLQQGLYEFQLVVTDNQGGSSTAIVKISVNKGSGSGDQLFVFPNPAQSVTTAKITSQVNGTIRLIVYDMNGRVVLTEQSDKSIEVFEKTLNVSTLAQGMYTIQVNISNRKTMVAKFIKL